MCVKNTRRTKNTKKINKIIFKAISLPKPLLLLPLLSALLLLLSLFLPSSIVHLIAFADGVGVNSILADVKNPVFNIQLTDGNVIFNNTEARKARNDNIATDDTEYSLYDRFGPDISYMPYFGEIKINTTLADKFYTLYMKNDLTFTSAIKEFFDKSSYEVNNVVWDNRVDISNDTQDPRYVAWRNPESAGANGALGNFWLGFAKSWNELETFVISDKMSEILFDFIESIFNSELMSSIKEIMQPLYVILIIAMLLNIARLTFKYMKGAGVGLKEIISKYIMSFLSFALILLLVSSPLIALPLIKIVRDVKNEAITDSFSYTISNDIINGSDNMIEATLWYINIFDPWCVGTYKKDYDHMYTQFADVADDQKMPMSNDNVLAAWDDGSLRYSAVWHCGDVSVPKGGGEKVRNWAALGYSVQSIYHIDATKGIIGTLRWPNAETCVKNPNIYVDDLRMIDAMLNISEEFSAVGETTGNIPSKGPNAPRVYDSSNMVPQAFVACFRTVIVTAFIAFFAVKAFIYLMEFVFYFALLIWNSILFLIRFDRGPLERSTSVLCEKFIAWVVVSVMEFVSITLYTTMYKTTLGCIVFIFICIIMAIMSPALSRREMATKMALMSIGSSGINKIKSFYSSR